MDDPFGPLLPSTRIKFNIFDQCIIAVLEVDSTDFLVDLCAAILEFGGSYRLDLNDLQSVTHVVCGSRTVSACTESLLKSVPKHTPIVSAQWIIDCCNWRRLLSTRSFSFAHHQALAKLDQVSGTWYSVKNLPIPTKPVFENKSIYLHSDIPDKYATRLVDIIIANGGSVSRLWPASVTIGVFRYAQSQTFIEAIDLGLSIASLHWLIDTIRLEEWTDPLDSVLHFPYPRRKHRAFPHIVICITGFLGRDRDYCKELIRIMGFQYRSDLNRETTILIAAKPEGKKFHVSTKTSWNKVHTVNVAWLEDSVQLGEPQITTSAMYTLFYGHLIDSPSVGLIPISQSTVIRVVQEAHLAIEKQASLNVREYNALIASAGKLGEQVTAPDYTTGRQAKLRGIDKVHTQYLELNKLSKKDRECVMRTWESGDAEFRLPEPDHVLDPTVHYPDSTDLTSNHHSELVPIVNPKPRLVKRLRSPNSTVPDTSFNLNPLHSPTKLNKRSNMLEVVVPLIRASKSLSTATYQSHNLTTNEKKDQSQTLLHRSSSLQTPPIRSSVQMPSVMLSRYRTTAHPQLAKIGIQINNNPSTTCTHLVINKPSYAERFLLGLATCQYIVTSHWLDACLQAGFPVDEQPYLLRNEEFEDEVKLTVAGVRAQLQAGPMLLGKGLSASPNQFNDPNTIHRLATALRATMVPFDQVSIRNELLIVVIVDPNVSQSELNAKGLLQDHVHLAVVDQLTCAIRCGQFDMHTGIPKEIHQIGCE